MMMSSQSVDSQPLAASYLLSSCFDGMKDKFRRQHQQQCVVRATRPVDIRNKSRNLIIYENCLDVSLFSRNVYTSSGDKTETSLCCCLEWRETKHWER
jgi:hypothetical protein